MIDLTHGQRRIVHRIVHKRFPGRHVHVFGSRARHQAKPWSDLDLVVDDSRPVSALALAEARADLEESDLPFHVDLVLWSDLPLSLQTTIRREGKIIDL